MSDACWRSAQRKTTLDNSEVVCVATIGRVSYSQHISCSKKNSFCAVSVILADWPTDDLSLCFVRPTLFHVCHFIMTSFTSAWHRPWERVKVQLGHKNCCCPLSPSLLYPAFLSFFSLFLISILSLLLSSSVSLFLSLFLSLSLSLSHSLFVSLSFIL